MIDANFEWDHGKEILNHKKHGVRFDEAQEAFFDPHRIIAKDKEHSTEKETRYFCFGKVGEEVLTVRFTYRNDLIRIIGAGCWRKGKKIYEQNEKKQKD